MGHYKHVCKNLWSIETLCILRWWWSRVVVVSPANVKSSSNEP